MKMLIGGKWVDKKKKIEVKNPLSNEVIDTVPAGDDKDVDKAISSAVRGFEVSRKLPVHERTTILYKTAQLLNERLEEFAVTIATEASKTIKEARGEARRCVNTLTVSAEEVKRLSGETLPFDSFPGAENRIGYYYRFPIGVIIAITPFNDPLNLVAHKLGPAIAGGNSVVLKPATVTPLSALKLGELFLEAGLPEEVLNIITGHGREIGDALVEDKRPRMISFTGGVEAGEEIMSKCGLKKIGMELGSNTPVIVCEDCDLNKAVSLTRSGAFWAVGQNCIGVQRVYIHEDIYDVFKNKFVAETDKMKTGEQLDEKTDMGPMITEEEAIRVEEWVTEAVNMGAKVLTGGERDGAVYLPTVLEDVPKDATIHYQEVFGPTVNLYPYKNLDKAIEEANSVDYGLHAGVFTKDIEKAFKVVYGLECGGVIVNDSSDYRLDMMPFGGVKLSGLGREGIKFALQEMTEPKVVCFNL